MPQSQLYDQSNISSYGQPVSSLYHQSIPARKYYDRSYAPSYNPIPQNNQPIYVSSYNQPIPPYDQNYNQTVPVPYDHSLYYYSNFGKPTAPPTEQLINQPIYNQPVTQPVYTQPVYNPPVMQLIVPQSNVEYAASGELTQTQKNQIVDAHNKFRALVIPPAANMPEMTWSDDLAKSAAKWSAQCIWGHSGQPGVGENLYVISPKTSNITTYNPTPAINDWASESANYNYNTNTCQPGKVCGHYTQVVWANSNKVGCAIQNCDSFKNLNFPGGTMVTCQYSPPGNYIGQRPYVAR